MNVNFEYYKIFYYVAKYQNITRAAAALGSNQPNVTRTMKLLEAQLNCRLFIREPRGISLTAEGKLLYSHVEIAYRHLINAQEEICGQDVQDSGTVEIGATETALHLFLLKKLHDFKMQYPKVRIKIHNHTTPAILRQLVDGRLDFAVLTTPFEAPKAFLCEKLLDFGEILVGGMQYRQLCDVPVKLKDMTQYPWIGLGEGTATYDLYKNFFLAHKLNMELDTEVATSDLMLPLIQNNLGIGFVPERLALPLLKKKSLVQIHIDCDVPGRALHLVSDRERGKGPAAHTFYKYLRDKS